jgi:hypothetical protein
MAGRRVPVGGGISESANMSDQMRKLAKNTRRGGKGDIHDLGPCDQPTMKPHIVDLCTQESLAYVPQDPSCFKFLPAS